MSEKPGKTEPAQAGPAGKPPEQPKPAPPAVKPEAKPGAKDAPKKVAEVGGPEGPEPTRYGDWERKGRVSDF
jgi:homeobox protein ESX1